MKKYFFGIGTVIVLILLAGAFLLLSGLYNVAADVPHWKITFNILDEARDISISRRDSPSLSANGSRCPPVCRCGWGSHWLPVRWA